MKLTATQLQELDAFILRKGIFYTEIREEILDHLACAVEEKMAQTPTMSFQKALDSTYASFGIFGFLDMEESIQKRIQKEVLRHFMMSFRSFFKLQRIIIPILIWLFSREIAQLLPDEDSKLLPALGLVSIGAIAAYFFLFKRSTKGPKSLLLHTARLNYLIGFTIMVQLVRFSPFLRDFGQEVFSYGAATLWMLSVLFFWATYQTYQWTKVNLRPPQTAQLADLARTLPPRSL